MSEATNLLMSFAIIIIICLLDEHSGFGQEGRCSICKMLVFLDVQAQ